MIKTKQKHTNHRFKFIFFLLISTFFVIPNIQGKSFKPNETGNLDIKEGKINSNPVKLSDMAADSGKTEPMDKHDISWTIIFRMSTISVVSPYLSFLWIRFLKDQPLNKQCALNHLSRDLIGVNLLYCWIWAVTPMIFKILDASGCERVFNEYAHGTSLLTEALLLILMMYLLMIGSLRLYTLRYNVLIMICSI